MDVGWMGCKGADGLTFRFSFVRLLPDATTFPSRTSTQPTGTSHRFSAPSASSSAARMNRSSSSVNSEACSVVAMDGARGFGVRWGGHPVMK